LAKEIAISIQANMKYTTFDTNIHASFMYLVISNNDPFTQEGSSKTINNAVNHQIKAPAIHAKN
jgi:hypothetical protein